MILGLWGINLLTLWEAGRDVTPSGVYRFPIGITAYGCPQIGVAELGPNLKPTGGKGRSKKKSAKAAVRPSFSWHRFELDADIKV